MKPFFDMALVPISVLKVAEALYATKTENEQLRPYHDCFEKQRVLLYIFLQKDLDFKLAFWNQFKIAINGNQKQFIRSMDGIQLFN